MPPTARSRSSCSPRWTGRADRRAVGPDGSRNHSGGGRFRRASLARSGSWEDALTTEDDIRHHLAPANWQALHERVVAAFARGWEAPAPQAWDGLMEEDVQLNQPLLQPGTTRRTWHDEAQRLVTLLPDLRGVVVSWAGHEDILFIELRLSATLGGKPLDFRAVDKLWLTPTGTILRRDSYFDSGPLMQAVLHRPSAWLPWWRSGLGPFRARRRFLQR